MIRTDVEVAVVYATRTMQDVVTVVLPAGSTLADAIQRSGLLGAHGLDPGVIAVAVHGQRRSPDGIVQHGDRIELLRPLEVDAKDARRHRAARQRPGRVAR